MSKYLTVFALSLSQYFVYRLNFILWRVRVMVSILITYFLWFSVFKSADTVLGYSQSRMLTYVLLITFINGVVLSTQTHRVAQEINMGELSNFLLHPIHFFGFNFARDAADKLINTIFSIVEIGLFIIILKPPIFIQTDVFWIGLFLITVVFSAILFFVVSLILSLIGFWSRETWSPRFIFFILVSFLAGIYFPLDIFPASIYNILKMLPFTYLVFFPLKIYLGEMPQQEVIGGLVMLLLWISVLSFLLLLLWKKGLKIYTAEGR